MVKLKTMMKLLKLKTKKNEKTQNIKALHESNVDTSMPIPNSTRNSLDNCFMDEIHDKASKSLQSITVKTCSSISMNNGSNAVHSFVHNEYNETDSILSSDHDDETKEQSKEDEIDATSSIENDAFTETEEVSLIIKESEGNNHEESVEKQHEKVSETLRNSEAQKDNNDIETEMKPLHIVTDSDQEIEFYNKATMNSPELSYPSFEATFISNTESPTQESLPSPKEPRHEEMAEEYDNDDKDELQYPSTPIIPNDIDASSLPMTNEDEDALQTIINYTQSAPSQSLESPASHQTSSKVLQPHPFSNADPAPTMHTESISDADNKAINPRISNLENMVQKVVDTNARLMQNFNKFMKKYDIDESVSSSCIQSPRATLSSIATFGSSTDTSFNFMHVGHKNNQNRSKSECFGILPVNKHKSKMDEEGYKANTVSFQPQNTQIQKPRKYCKYKSNRGPKLNTAHRAVKRQTFDMENKRRIEIEKIEEKRRLKQLQIMEEQIVKERMKLTRYKARPIKKFKPTKIVLPRRKLKITKVAIYDRGLKLQKEKEDYLKELRRLRDIQMGITYDASDDKLGDKQQSTDSNGVIIPDVAMRCNVNDGEKRLRAMQSLRLRQN